MALYICFLFLLLFGDIVIPNVCRSNASHLVDCFMKHLIVAMASIWHA